MSTPNLVRFLSNASLATPGVKDLLLPVFGGQILTAFEDYLQFNDKLKSYTLSTGDTMKFPALWKIGSEYHEAGQEILGMDIQTKEYTITLEDRPLVTAREFDDLDQMLSHFDVRGDIATEMGRELARQVDKKQSILIAKAALDGVAESTATDFPNKLFTTGKVVNAALDDAEGAAANFTKANLSAMADAFTAVVSQVVNEWNKNFVPQNDRFVAVTPTMFMALRMAGIPSFVTAANNTIQNPLMGHKNVTFIQGPSTVVANTPDIYLEYLGCRIFQSQNTPWNTNISTGPSKWQANLSNVYGLAFQKDCVGWITKLGVVTESARKVETQSDLLLAKTWVGGGTLRPFCSCLLATA